MGRAILAGIAVSATYAAAGVAVGALTPTTDRTTISPDQKGISIARCDRGTEAVSGGFNSPGFAAGANGVYVHVSKRGSKRTVRASGHQTASSESGLVAYAYCDRENRDLKVRSASTPVGDGDDASVTAKCPRGSEAVWGGFANPNVPADEPRFSRWAPAGGEAQVDGFSCVVQQRHRPVDAEGDRVLRPGPAGTGRAGELDAPRRGRNGNGHGPVQTRERGRVRRLLRPRRIQHRRRLGDLFP